MTTHSEIEFLRERWYQSQRMSMSQEMLAFANLCEHLDVRWQDLLEGLKRPGIVGEDAWLQLRIKLKEAGAGMEMRRDPNIWREVLVSRGIDPDSRCRVIAQGAA